MKLLNSMGPNPQVVRMYAAEIGATLELETVDIMGGENRQPAYLAKNPQGQLPCLIMDNGEYLSEVTAICEYLDEKSSGTSLIGSTAEERAAARMWARRVDLYLCEPLANGFRFSEGLELFKDRMTTLPESADGLKRLAREKLVWFNGLMEGNEFLAGDRITLADILLFCFLAFGKNVGQPYDESLGNLHAWFQRMESRPSATA